MQSWQPSASLETIRQRARLYRNIRHYFGELDYLEVDTPLLSQATISDVNIDSISTLNGSEKSYLQTSPEFFMKRLLAAGSGSCYQITHAFRAGEQGGRHNPEFSLLEWYSLEFDYSQLMDQVEHLILQLLPKLAKGFNKYRYSDVFFQQLDIDIEQISLVELRNYTDQRVAGVDTSEYNFDQCLDLLLSHVILPEFQGFTFLYDYPSSQAALARLSESNNAVAERFELFYNDLELANGFSELTNADEQRRRFANDNLARKALNKPVSPVDERFLSALDHRLPTCAGVAIGLDRLLMVICEKENIKQVLTFMR